MRAKLRSLTANLVLLVGSLHAGKRGPSARFQHFPLPLLQDQRLPVVQAFRQPLLAWRGGEYAPEFISSAVDVRKITDHVNNRRVARYVLSEMRALAQQDGFRLVLAMDGVRDAIYAGEGLESYEVGKLNRLVGQVASELDIPLLDLHATFAHNRQRFEFAYDGHWNVLATRLVGEAIARLLLRRPVGGVGAERCRCGPAPARVKRRRVSSQVQLRTPWLSNHSTRAVAAA
jgi:hypothetical protein